MLLFVGVRHEGTAEGELVYLILSCLAFNVPPNTAVLGTYEEINGIKTYVATPKTDYPKDKAVLYLPDVFGLELLNNRARHRFLPLSLIYPAYKLA